MIHLNLIIFLSTIKIFKVISVNFKYLNKALKFSSLILKYNGIYNTYILFLIYDNLNYIKQEYIY